MALFLSNNDKYDNVCALFMLLSSSGLGRWVLSPVTRVRIPVGAILLCISEAICILPFEDPAPKEYKPVSFVNRAKQRWVYSGPDVNL